MGRQGEQLPIHFFGFFTGKGHLLIHFLLPARMLLVLLTHIEPATYTPDRSVGNGYSEWQMLLALLTHIEAATYTPDRFVGNV